MTDILIRGTYFPRNDYRVFRIYADGRVEGEYTGIPLGAAIELPEHGDLVDADELRAVAYERGKEHRCVSFVDPLDITLAPVIVPANKEKTE